MPVKTFGLLVLALASAAPPPAAGKAPAAGTYAPESVAALPNFHKRSEWDPKWKETVYDAPLGNPTRITVHHTEEKQPLERKAIITELQRLLRIHTSKDPKIDGRGWSDIGYHFLIDAKGQIWEGRPIYAQGSHVAGQNENNIGISLMGNFDLEHTEYNKEIPLTKPTAAQLEALAALLNRLGGAYGIPLDRQHVFGHRDLDAKKTCPGQRLYDQLDAVCQAASRKAAAMASRIDTRPAENIQERLRLISTGSPF
ncbi:MAG: peptidoglycan recognition family protein [Elusimicrobia bacterium]|nr:peptidoglycan recognition family protein [Elusimicrobiota bacterium]